MINDFGLIHANQLKSIDNEMVFALTIDQRGSRRSEDAVPGLLSMLDSWPVVRRFERTAGDEVQGLVEQADTVVEIVSAVVVEQRWWIGIGSGSVEQDLPASVRASRGPALIAARVAVERAKTASGGLSLEPAPGVDPDLALDAETALQMLTRLLNDRTDHGREAIQALRGVVTQAQAAERLGISPQAMSRRLHVARLDDEARLRRLAVRLLARL